MHTGNPRRRRAAPPLVALGAAALVLGAGPGRAAASGFYMTDRGVRPMGRAGAFVAGADDQHAIWYNPAGLALAGNGLLLDVSYLGWGNRYTRQAQPTPDSPVVDFPPVSGAAAPLPIPTLVVTHNFNRPGWMFAAALFAPNAVITSYPEAATAPQRYSVVSLEGSSLALAGVWAAYAPSRQLSFGMGVQVLAGTFVSNIVLSGCPATITCQPEDPDWDAAAQLRVGPIVAPTANAGVRWQPTQAVVLGLSGQLPLWIDAPATLAVRLPSHPFYDGAQVEGDRAQVGFTLAPILRAGVELRPTRTDRVEFAVVYEGWGVHDRISLTPVRDEAQPRGIRITNVRGVGTYEVGPTAIERRFRDALSLRLGYERDQDLGNGWHLFPRAGVSFDMSATAPESTSVLTQDADKVILTVGASLARGPMRLDVHLAHAFANNVAVDPADARLYQVRPFRTNDQAPRYGINGGLYEMSLTVVGVGWRYQF